MKIRDAIKDLESIPEKSEVIYTAINTMKVYIKLKSEIDSISIQESSGYSVYFKDINTYKNEIMNIYNKYTKSIEDDYDKP